MERGRSLVLRNGNPKQSDISIAKFGKGTREVGEAHSTVRPKGQHNLWLGKGLYFRDANIEPTLSVLALSYSAEI